MERNTHPYFQTGSTAERRLTYVDIPNPGIIAQGLEWAAEKKQKEDLQKRRDAYIKIIADLPLDQQKRIQEGLEALHQKELEQKKKMEDKIAFTSISIQHNLSSKQYPDAQKNFQALLADLKTLNSQDRAKHIGDLNRIIPQWGYIIDTKKSPAELREMHATEKKEYSDAEKKQEAEKASNEAAEKIQTSLGVIQQHLTADPKDVTAAEKALADRKDDFAKLTPTKRAEVIRNLKDGLAYYGFTVDLSGDDVVLRAMNDAEKKEYAEQHEVGQKEAAVSRALYEYASSPGDKNQLLKNLSEAWEKLEATSKAKFKDRIEKAGLKEVGSKIVKVAPAAPEKPKSEAEKAVQAAITAINAADGALPLDNALKDQKNILEPLLENLSETDANKLIQELNKGIASKGKKFEKDPTDAKKLKIVDLPAAGPAGAPPPAPERQESNFIKLLREIFKWIREFMEDWKQMTVKDRQEFLGYQKRQTEALEKRNQLDDQLKQLNKTIKEQEAEIKKMKEEKVPREELEQAQKRFDQMQRKRDSVMAELEAANRNIQILQKESDKLAGKVKDLNTRLTKAIEENDALRGLEFLVEPQGDGTVKMKIKWTAAQKEKLGTLRDALKKEKIHAELKVDATKNTSELVINVASTEELKNVQEQLYYAEYSLGLEELAHEQTKQEKKKVEGERDTEKTRADQLQASLTIVTGKLDKAKQDLGKAEAERDAAAKRAGEIEAEMKKLEATGKAKDEASRKQMARLSGLLSKEKATVQERDNEIAKNKLAITNLTNEKKMVEGQLNKEQSEHGVTRVKLTVAEKQIGELSRKLDDKGKEYDALKIEKEAADKNVKEKEEALKQLQAAKDKGDKEAQGKIDALNTELSTAKSERDAKIADLGDAKKALEAEGKKLADALEKNKQVRDFLVGMKDNIDPDHIKFHYDADKKLTMISPKDPSNPEHARTVQKAIDHAFLEFLTPMCGPCGVVYTRKYPK